MNTNLLSAYLAGLRSSIRPTRRLRSDRLWEIDMLRGVAIVMMVIYHLLWDLQGLGGYKINVYTGFWHYFQLATASLFTGLVGVSLALRHQSMQTQRAARYGPFFLRGAAVFTWGVVVGIVTYFFNSNLYVRWGILHLIGFSILIAWPFLRFRWLNLALGIALLLLRRGVALAELNLSWLDWLGLDATPRLAFDYFPIIPWFGLPLIGIFVGNTLYARGLRRFSLPDLSTLLPLRLLRLMGQNSLLIYLLHQPIMIALLMLFGIVSL